MLKQRSISKTKKKSAAKKQDRRESRQFASKVSMGIILISGVVALVVVANKWLAKEQLRDIRIVGKVVLDTTEVLEQAALTDSIVLREINLRDVEGRVAAHPFIRNAAAYYGGDGQLIIEIEERSPVAATVLDGLPVYLDANGIPLPFRFGLAAPDVPVLSGILEEEGKQIDSAKVLEAVGVVAALRDHSEAIYRRIATVQREASGEYTLALTDGAVSVRAGLPGEIGPRLSKLDAFLRNVLAAEGADRAGLIDIRWDGQVVVHWRQQRQRA